MHEILYFSYTSSSLSDVLLEKLVLQYKLNWSDMFIILSHIYRNGKPLWCWIDKLLSRAVCSGDPEIMKIGGRVVICCCIHRLCFWM